jgi:predicted alpha/beta-hydrolase family hydrolase
MANGPDRALLLTPGAGSSADHSSLLLIEERVAPMPVRRMDFPYRLEGRKAPDRAPKLLAAIDAGAEAFLAETGVAPDRLILGGRSMGGRMCSMAVADGRPALGLVLIAYPLHPPGKPDKLRIEHLPAIEVPTLVLSGTRDPFGTPDELTEHFAAVPGPVTHHWIEGGRHDLGKADEELATVVADWVAAL